MKHSGKFEFFLAPPSDAPSEHYLELKRSLKGVRLFEQLLYRLLERRLDLRLCSLAEERAVAIEVTRSWLRAGGERREDGQIGIIFAPLDPLVRRYRPRPVPCHLIRPECTPAVQSWLEERNARLKVRPDKWSGVSVMAASSLPVLLLDFLTSSGLPMLQLRRELAHVQSGVRDHVHVQANLMEQEHGFGLRETFWVSLEKLGRLVAQRAAKMPVSLEDRKGDLTYGVIH